jgi:protein tyrosine/serine phosphatase
MRVHSIRVRVFAALLGVASLAGPAFAQSAVVPASSVTATKASLSRIRIDNFGKINDNYFRGSQPRGNDYADLAAIGVKTVIDLQKDGPSNEAGIVQRDGMQFFRIGMTTSDAPTSAQIKQFFDIVNNPANQPVYVHCAGGRHRTGTMTALFRMTQDGWTPQQAYTEMKQYRFEGFPDHPVLRNFVYAYKPSPIQAPPAVLATAVIPAAVASK